MNQTPPQIHSSPQNNITPQELHERISNSAVDYLRRAKGPDEDHVIVTEHYTTKVFQQLTPLDLTTYPTTFGPEDDDPFISFKQNLHEASTKINPEKVTHENPIISKKVMDFHRDYQKKRKKSMIISPVNPIPSYLQPKEVMLSSKAIKRSHTLTEGKKVLPYEPSQLGGKVKQPVLKFVENQPIKEVEVNLDKALNTVFSYTILQQQQCRNDAKERKASMKPHLDLMKGETKDHPILNEWNRATTELYQRLPRSISPPMLPLPPQYVYDDVPEDPQQMKDQLIPEEMQGITRDYCDNGEEGSSDDAYRLEHLDTFDGEVYPPLTPSSVMSGPSNETRFTNYQIDTPPASTFRYQTESEMHWDGPSRIEPPMFPINHETHPDFGDQQVHLITTPDFSPTSGEFGIAQLPISGYAHPAEASQFSEKEAEWNDSTSTVFREHLDPAAFQDLPADHLIQDDGNYQEADIDQYMLDYAVNEKLDANQPGIMEVPRDVNGMDLTAIDPSTFTDRVEDVMDNYNVPYSTYVKYPGMESVLANDPQWEPTFDMAGPYNTHQAANTECPMGEPQSTIPADFIDPANISYPSRTSQPFTPRERIPISPVHSQTVAWYDDQAYLPVTTQSQYDNPAPVVPTSTTHASTNFEYSNHTVPAGASFTQSSDQRSPPRVIPAKRPVETSARHATRRSHKAFSTGVQSLEDIVAARKLDTVKSSKPSSATKNGTRSVLKTKLVQLPKAPNPFSLNGFLTLEERKDLVRTPSPTEYNKQLDIEIAALEKQNKIDWMTDELIRNPRWYINSSNHTHTPREKPLPILVSMSVIQQIPFTRALRSEGFELIERENKMHCTDIALSPSTAVILQNLTKGYYNEDRLIQDLKIAAVYFNRIIVIFETISYSAFEKSKDAKKNKNPLNTEIRQGLAALKRLTPLALRSTGKSTGKVELVFAYNGAGEVSKALMGLVNSEGKKMLKKDEKSYLEIYGDRQWLNIDPSEEEVEQLATPFGLNIFCAWYALDKVGNIHHLVSEMNDKEREDMFKVVFGEGVMERFNDEVAQKKWLLRGKGD